MDLMPVASGDEVLRFAQDDNFAYAAYLLPLRPSHSAAGPALGIGRADLLAPEGLAAEVTAPHPEPSRVVVQDVFVGEAIAPID